VTGCVAAILLAAGRSRRMGSCKQLLPLGDRTVISRCLDALVTGGVGEVVVVVSEEGSEVAEAARANRARIVVNPETAGDMASSVRVGRDALPAEACGVIVALCDYPLVSAATVTRLIEEHMDSPGSIIIPCHGGRRGHNPERIRCLDVDDPGVLIDMDTPEDYHRICGMFESV
jgi:molybdenum cofactor cytidylyltransferase